MDFEPKILINRTGKTVEFSAGGQIFIFKPGEKKLLEGFVANQALNFTRTGLEEYTPIVEDEEVKKSGVFMPDYAGLKFQKLVSLTKKDFRPGMTKEALVTLLQERWQKKNNELAKSIAEAEATATD
jgi:hypothetical protein